ncbi:hypothetical protein AKJ16_DCAP18276 [Drosera capensis]
MVVNSGLVAAVAKASTELWRRAARISDDEFSSEQILSLTCFLPLQQLGRLFLSLWTYLCYSPNQGADFSYNYNHLSSDDEDEEEDGDDGFVTPNLWKIRRKEEAPATLFSDFIY